jgi:hypothetical protein
VIVNNDTLRKCVYQDTSNSAQFIVRNDGPCPITITTTISDPSIFQVQMNNGMIVQSGMSMTLPPRPALSHEEICKIRTTVNAAQWAANPMRPFGPDSSKIFTGTITITGCDSVPVRIPVVAVVRKECRAFTYQCMRQFRPPSFQNTYAESIRLVPNEAKIEYQNDNQGFTVYDIFVDSLYSSGGSGRVDLSSGQQPGVGGVNGFFGGFMKVTSNFYVPPGQNICSTNPVNSSSICDLARITPGMLQAPITDLQVGDVILFYKGEGNACALIWIQEIGPDRTGGPSLDKVCMEICYPVFMP